MQESYYMARVWPGCQPFRPFLRFEERAARMSLTPAHFLSYKNIFVGTGDRLGVQ